MLTLTIERLGINGEGIARLEGYTIFIAGALPGETVLAELYEQKSRYGRAQLIKILSSSPKRQQPSCPYFGSCGGCQLMHLDYQAQLETKRQRVQDAMERIGKLKVEVHPCIPSPDPLAYRNKIQMPIVSGRLGLYAYNSHDLVEIDSCKIHCHLGDQLFQKIQKLLQSSSEKIKHLLIKTAINTKEALVIFVTAEKATAGLQDLAQQILSTMPEVKGVIQNINSTSSNTILGDTFHTLAGNDAIEEILCGLKFKVSPASFFQVNPAQAEQLYQKVAEFAALTGEEHLLDAYCGVGTLSLILAKGAKQMTGIECVAPAIKDAEENARKNGIANATFICAPAEEGIKALEKVDVAIVNPPRKGCEGEFLDCLARLKPRRIIYISCDPATLARDIAILSAKGFQVEAVQPFDMFPQTAHVETVVKIQKIK